MRRQTANQTLKRLAKDLTSHTFLLFLAFLGTIVQVALSIYLPILIGQVIDQVLVAGSSPVFWQIFLQMILVVIGNTLVQWANPLLYNRLIFSYTRDLREQIIHKLHRLPIAFVDRQGSGEMVSRVTTDIEQLAAGLTMIFNQFFIGVLMILVSILAMIQIHLLMTLLVLLLTPLSMVISRFIAKRSYHLFQKQTETRGIQTQLIEESLSQQTIIQSFNAQEEFIQRLREANDNYAGYSQSAIFYSSTVNPSTRFVNALIYALLAGVGAYRIMIGSTLTIGRLVTFLNYVQQYTKPFNDISSVLAELQSALACAERVYGVLDSPEVAETGKEVLTIARVFLAIPKILILDEATSSIDTRTEVLVQDAFAKLMKGRTSFIIAHRLSTIQDADLILVLVDGDIVEYGNHHDLMARKGKYYQMQQAAAFISE